MRVLLNYTMAEKPYLGMLKVVFSRLGITAMSTAKTLSITDMIETAKQAKAQAVVICNERTLRNVAHDKATLDEFRGSRLTMSVPALVINKLEHMVKVNHGMWLLEKDLTKLKHITRPTTPFTMDVLTDPADFKRAEEDLSKGLLMAFDIETNGKEVDKYNTSAKGKAAKNESLEVKDIYMTCVSFTIVRNDLSLHTYVLPLVDFDECHWRRDEDYANALLFMRRVLANPVPKAMQNGTYDAVHSIVYRMWINNWVIDTMILAHAEFSELPKSLDFIASLELYDYRQWKYESEEAGKTKNMRQYWAYNGQDTFYTARIALQQLQNKPHYAYKNYGKTFSMVYPTIYSAFEGFKVDPNIRHKLASTAEHKLETSLAKLKAMTGDEDFNPGSWQQKEHLLYKVLGAKKPNIGKSASCTDKKNLDAVSQQHPLFARFVTDILEYQANSKAIGTYFKFWQKNGRLLYQLNPAGTETGRMSCNASNFNCGTQVQNVPKYAKVMLVPDVDERSEEDPFVIIDADFSKAEAVCTAHLSGSVPLIKALSDPEKDFYKALGTLFFSIPYPEVTTEFRNKVLKKIVHGTNYMMGAQTFIENAGAENLYLGADILGITITPIPRRGNANEMTMKQFATMLLNSYHDPFPEVREWYKQIKNEVATTGMLVSPLGHTRKFFGDIRKNHNILRGAVAHRPQNLSVSILNEAYLQAYKQLVPKYHGDYRIKGQVHDSLVQQCRLSILPEVLAQLRDIMTIPVEVNGRVMTIEVDFAVSTKSWGDVVELENGLLPEVF